MIEYSHPVVKEKFTGIKEPVTSKYDVIKWSRLEECLYTHVLKRENKSPIIEGRHFTLYHIWEVFVEIEFINNHHIQFFTTSSELILLDDFQSMLEDVYGEEATEVLRKVCKYLWQHFPEGVLIYYE